MAGHDKARLKVCIMKEISYQRVDELEMDDVSMIVLKIIGLCNE